MGFRLGSEVDTANETDKQTDRQTDRHTTADRHSHKAKRRNDKRHIHPSTMTNMSSKDILVPLVASFVAGFAAASILQKLSGKSQKTLAEERTNGA